MSVYIAYIYIIYLLLLHPDFIFLSPDKHLWTAAERHSIRLVSEALMASCVASSFLPVEFETVVLGPPPARHRDDPPHLTASSENTFFHAFLQVFKQFWQAGLKSAPPTEGRH